MATTIGVTLTFHQGTWRHPFGHISAHLDFPKDSKAADGISPDVVPLYNEDSDDEHNIREMDAAYGQKLSLTLPDITLDDVEFANIKRQVAFFQDPDIKDEGLQDRKKDPGGKDDFSFFRNGSSHCIRKYLNTLYAPYIRKKSGADITKDENEFALTSGTVFQDACHIALLLNALQQKEGVLPPQQLVDNLDNIYHARRSASGVRRTLKRFLKAAFWMLCAYTIYISGGLGIFVVGPFYQAMFGASLLTVIGQGLSQFWQMSVVRKVVLGLFMAGLAVGLGFLAPAIVTLGVTLPVVIALSVAAVVGFGYLVNLIGRGIEKYWHFALPREAKDLLGSEEEGAEQEQATGDRQRLTKAVDSSAESKIEVAAGSVEAKFTPPLPHEHVVMVLNEDEQYIGIPDWWATLKDCLNGAGSPVGVQVTVAPMPRVIRQDALQQVAQEHKVPEQAVIWLPSIIPQDHNIAEKEQAFLDYVEDQVIPGLQRVGIPAVAEFKTFLEKPLLTEAEYKVAYRDVQNRTRELKQEITQLCQRRNALVRENPGALKDDQRLPKIILLDRVIKECQTAHKVISNASNPPSVSEMRSGIRAYHRARKSLAPLLWQGVDILNLERGLLGEALCENGLFNTASQKALQHFVQHVDFDLRHPLDHTVRAAPQ